MEFRQSLINMLFILFSVLKLHVVATDITAESLQQGFGNLLIFVVEENRLAPVNNYFQYFFLNIPYLLVFIYVEYL